MAREVELNKVAGGGGDLEAMAAASSEVRGRLGHFFQVAGPDRTRLPAPSSSSQPPGAAGFPPPAGCRPPPPPPPPSPLRLLPAPDAPGAGPAAQEKRAKSHFAQDVKNGRGGWLAKYAQLAERRPRQLLAASLGVCFALTVVAMALGAFNMAEETNYDWIVKSDPAVQKNFMISLASEDQSEGLE